MLEGTVDIINIESYNDHRSFPIINNYVQVSGIIKIQNSLKFVYFLLDSIHKYPSHNVADIAQKAIGSVILAG